jgi:hypothetical protein
MLPPIEFEKERYQGRPLLVLLENYILAAIGALSNDKRSRVAKVVETTFGSEHEWMQTIRNQLDLDDQLDSDLNKMWVRNQEIALQNGVKLHPVQFAKMIVDQNFADLIDRISPRAE